MTNETMSSLEQVYGTAHSVTRLASELDDERGKAATSKGEQNTILDPRLSMSSVATHHPRTVSEKDSHTAMWAVVRKARARMRSKCE